MLEINKYILPGVYAEAANQDRLVVVIDVVTQLYNPAKQLHEHNPHVLYRPLIETREMHERFCTPLEVFKEKFLTA